MRKGAFMFHKGNDDRSYGNNLITAENGGKPCMIRIIAGTTKREPLLGGCLLI